jgi:hypothetical protein
MKVRIEIEIVKTYIYDAYDVKEIIKQIPGRKWEADRRRWSIYTSDVGLLLLMLKRDGHHGVITDRRWKPRSSKPSSAIKRTWADELFAALKGKPHLADKVFKALTLALHPDAGGDHELMVQLNVARDKTRG